MITGESLTGSASVRKLQTVLHAKAKEEPGRRFHALVDKVWRKDFLLAAWALVRRNGGAAGVDGVTVADVGAYGVERWVGELSRDLREGTYKPSPVRQVLIPKKQPGKFRFDEQGLETDLWETNYAPLRKRAENAASPKGTAPAPDSTGIRGFRSLRYQRADEDRLRKASWLSPVTQDSCVLRYIGPLWKGVRHHGATPTLRKPIQAPAVRNAYKGLAPVMAPFQVLLRVSSLADRSESLEYLSQCMLHAGSQLFQFLAPFLADPPGPRHDGHIAGDPGNEDGRTGTRIVTAVGRAVESGGVGRIAELG